MGESGAEMAGLRIVGDGAAARRALSRSKHYGTALRTTLLGVRNWRCSFWGGFLCLFLFLFSFFPEPLGRDTLGPWGKRVRRGRAQTVCVISGCLIVMAVRGIRASCL